MIGMGEGSDRRRLVLHIGRHKSGTTTLQRFLVANEEVLAREGFVYPNALRQPEAHHPLALWYSKRHREKLTEAEERSQRERIDAFWDEIGGAPRVIASSEAFQNARPDWMVEDFAPFELTIVVYLREPLDYLLSAYAQKVKAGNTAETIDEFVEGFDPNYDVFLARWSKAFPDAELQVRVFDRERLIGRDIRVDFLHCIGMQEGVIERFTFPQGDANVTIGGELLEFVRRLNLFDVDLGKNRMRFYYATQALASRFPEYRRKPPTPRKLQQLVRERAAGPLGVVAATYFGGEIPFERKEFPVGDEAHRLGADDVETILARLEEEDETVAREVGERIGPVEEFARALATD